MVFYHLHKCSETSNTSLSALNQNAGNQCWNSQNAFQNNKQGGSGSALFV